MARRKSPSAAEALAILTRIESQGRLTFDAVLLSSIRALCSSVQAIGVGVHQLRTEVWQNSAAIRDLTARMDALSRVEERVTALEKR